MSEMESCAEEEEKQRVRLEQRRVLGLKIAGIAAIYAIEKVGVAASRHEHIRRPWSLKSFIFPPTFVVQGVNKGLSAAKVKVPSSLASMLLWLGGLKALEVHRVHRL